MSIIGPAEIQILPNTTGFAAALERQLAPSLNTMVAQVNRALGTVTQDFDQLGRNAAEAFTQVEFDDAFDGITKELDTTGDEITDELVGAVREAINGIADEFDGDAARRMLAGLDIDDEFDQIVGGLGDDVRRAVQDIEREFGKANIGDALADDADQAGNRIVQAFRGVGQRINTTVGTGLSLGTGIAAGARTAATQVSQAFDNVGDKISDRIGLDLSEGLGTAARTAATRIATQFSGLGQRLSDELDITDRFRTITARLSSEADNVTRRLEATFRRAGDRIPDALRVQPGRLWEGLETRAGRVADGIADQFDSAKTKITEALTSAVDFGVGFGSSTVAKARDAADRIVDQFEAAGDAIRTQLRDGVDSGLDLLRRVDYNDTFAGLVTGARTATRRLVDDLGDTATRISQRFADRLDFDVSFGDVTDRVVKQAGDAADKIRESFDGVASKVNDALGKIGDKVSFGDGLRVEAGRLADRVVDQFAGVGRRISDVVGRGAEVGSSVVSSARTAARRVVDEFSDVGSKIGKSITSGAEKALKALPVVAAGVGLGVAAAFGAALFEGVQREQISDIMLGSLDLDPDETQRIAKLAADIYANAYGESFEDIAGTLRDALAVDIPESQVRRVVEQTESMQAAFGGASEGYIALVAQLEEQGVVETVTEGLDLIVSSFTRLPSELQEPLSEAIREYAVFLDDLGFSAEETFALFTRFGGQGEFALDKAGDALKEFTIRATDMSTASVEAFDLVGLSAEEMATAVLEGGPAARTAFEDIVEGLLSIEDPASQANAAIALFGTPLEDLAVSEIPLFLEGLLDIEGGLGDVEGAVDRLDARINDNFGVTFETFKRTVGGVFTELADSIIGPALERINPRLNELAEWMRTEGPEAAARIEAAVTPIINDLGDALENVDWEGILSSISDRLGEIDVAEIGEALQNVDWNQVAADITAVAEAIGDIIVATAEIIEFLGELSGAFGDVTSNNEDMVNSLSTGWVDLTSNNENMVESITGGWSTMQTRNQEMVDAISNGWVSMQENNDGMVAALSAGWSDLQTNNEGLVDAVSSAWVDLQANNDSLVDGLAEGWVDAQANNDAFVEAVGSAWGDMQTNNNNLVAAISDGWTDMASNGERLVDFLAGQWADMESNNQGMVDAISQAWGDMQSNNESVVDAMQQGWADMSAANRGLVDSFFGLRDDVSAAASAAKELVIGAFRDVKDYLSGLLSGVSLGTLDVIGVLGPIGSVITIVGTAIDKLKEFIGLSGTAAKTQFKSFDGTKNFLPDSGSGGSGGGGGISVFGEGGLATEPSLVAEDFRPEIVLPLTKPDRMQAVINQYANEIIAAAGGIDVVIDALTGGATGAGGVVGSPTVRLPEPAVAAVSRGPAAGRALSGSVDRSSHVVNNYNFHGAEAGEVARTIARDRRADLLEGLRIRG